MLRGVDDLEVGEDDLERPLKDLRLAPDVQEVARLEQASQVLGGVPEACSDAAGLVAQLQVQIEIALAIGPELLVRDQKRLVDRVAMDQLIDVAAGHAANRLGETKAVAVKPGTVSGERSIVGASRRRGQGSRSFLGTGSSGSAGRTGAEVMPSPASSASAWQSRRESRCGPGIATLQTNRTPRACPVRIGRVNSATCSTMSKMVPALASACRRWRRSRALVLAWASA